MKIISLQTENVKCLRAVEIAPGGDSIEIAGKNGAGKSSVLDSIFYALGGQKHVCERPIRDGQSSAKVVLELDDYTVTRTFTASGGGTLKVVARNPLPGTVAKLLSPQAVLDALVGDLAFDPLAFTRLKPEDQSNLLRKLAGINTAVLEAEYETVYDERTEIGRQSTALAGKISGQHPKDMPGTEIDVKDILEARAAVTKRNEAIQVAQKAHADLNWEISLVRKELGARSELITSLEEQLKEAKQKKNQLDAKFVELNDRLGSLVVPPLEDLSEFDRQILDAQTTNATIRSNNELKAIVSKQESLVIQYNGKTKRLDALALQKDKLVTDAKYPVPGLGFSSTGSVTFNGVPFEQLSTAQRLKISAAIGIALNPKLRVMLIRDGSAMDEDTLAELVLIAANNDTQLWIERVGKLSGELPGVVIEDGSVAESTLPQIPEAEDSKNTDCV